jgi:hypothetical protein
MSGQLNKSSLDQDTFSQYPTQVAIHKFLLFFFFLFNKWIRKKLWDLSLAAYLDARIQSFDKDCNPTAAAILPGGNQNDPIHIGDLGNEIHLLGIHFLNQMANSDGGDASSFPFGCHQLIWRLWNVTGQKSTAFVSRWTDAPHLQEHFVMIFQALFSFVWILRRQIQICV